MKKTYKITEEQLQQLEETISNELLDMFLQMKNETIEAQVEFRAVTQSILKHIKEIRNEG